MRTCAEIGINHGGSFTKCIEMVQEAYRCGCDCVKTQLYYTDTICLNRDCFQAYTLLEKNKTHPSWLPLIKTECDNLGIEFICTPFCRYSAEEVAPYVNLFKVASPEVCDLGFIKHLMTYNKPLILSTGKTTPKQLDDIFDIATVPIILLYCVSKYPAMPEDYDLNAIDALKSKYRCPVGLSDHTTGLTLSKLAIDKGAYMIERHFKLDNKCIDAAVSITPKGMLELTKYSKYV